jgi:CRP-like cAMP-binding protein
LLQLLVHRLGQRRGPWYHLPMRLKHESLAEMVNHSRVTVTRHMSRWRKCGWIDPGGPGCAELRLAPELVEG